MVVNVARNDPAKGKWATTGFHDINIQYNQSFNYIQMRKKLLALLEDHAQSVLVFFV